MRSDPVKCRIFLAQIIIPGADLRTGVTAWSLLPEFPININLADQLFINY